MIWTFHRCFVFFVAFGSLQLLPASVDQAVVDSLPKIEVERLREFLATYQAMQNWEMTRAVAAELVSKNPNDETALKAFAEAAVEMGNADAALDASRRYLKLDGGDKGMALRARTLAAGKKHDEAIQILEQIRSQSGGSFKHDAELGFAYQAAGKMDEAEVAFQRLANREGSSQRERLAANRQLQTIAKDRRVKRAYDALANNDIQGAAEIAAELHSEQPDGVETKILRANIFLQAGEPMRAYHLLTDVRNQVSNFYPYAIAYANSLTQIGQIEVARKTLRNMVNYNGEYSDPKQAAEAVRQLQEIRRNYDAKISSKFGTLSGAEGDAWHVATEIRTSEAPGWSFAAKHEYANLNSTTPLKLKSTEGLNHGYGEVRWRAPNGYGAGGRVGVTYGDSYAAAWLGRTAFSNAPSWRVSFEHNRPSSDGVKLRSLEAMEDRLEATWASSQNKKLRASATAHLRSVSAQGQDLGSGAGFRWDLATRILSADDGKLFLDAAYTGSLTKFSANRFDQGALGFPENFENALGSLIDTDYHTHGAELRLGWIASDSTYINLWAGPYYRVDDGKVTLGAGGSIEHVFAEDWTFNANFGYYTSGQGENAGAGYWEAAAGLSRSF